MMASCIHRLTPSSAPVPEGQQKEKFNFACREFNMGCGEYGFATIFYTASLFSEEGEAMRIFSYCVKGLVCATFLKSAWDSRKVQKFEALDFALCSVVVVVGVVAIEAILAGDPIENKYSLAVLGTSLHLALLGAASYVAYKYQYDNDYIPVT